MSNKKVIAELEWIKEHGLKSNIVGVDCAIRAINKAVKLIKALDKYAWHDLNKNPEDLPEADIKCPRYSVDVLLAFPYCDGSPCYLTGYYRYETKDWYSEYIENLYELIDDNPIKWKYIEPFE